jgi:hypothetical protein
MALRLDQPKVGVITSRRSSARLMEVSELKKQVLGRANPLFQLEGVS